MRLALTPAVPLRTRIARALVATAIVFGSIVAVGVTAPAEAPFTITFRPVLANIGFDIDVKVWRVHVSFAWSAIPSTATSTKIEVTPL
jgi:hypothetical protein